MSSPFISLQDYRPDPVVYGTHVLSWDWIQTSTGGSLVLTCDVCLSSIKHPITVTGAGRVHVKPGVPAIVHYDDKTFENFVKAVIPDCDKVVINIVTNS